MQNFTLLPHSNQIQGWNVLASLSVESRYSSLPCFLSVFRLSPRHCCFCLLLGASSHHTLSSITNASTWLTPPVEQLCINHLVTTPHLNLSDRTGRSLLALQSGWGKRTGGIGSLREGGHLGSWWDLHACQLGGIQLLKKGKKEAKPPIKTLDSGFPLSFSSSLLCSAVPSILLKHTALIRKHVWL